MMTPTLMFHGIGIGLAGLAFAVFARQIVRNRSGKGFKPLPVLALMVSVLVFHLVYPFEGLMYRLGGLMVDGGIGMILGALVLARHREHPKMLRVPGIILAILGFFAYGLMYVSSYVNSGAKSDPAAVQLLLELGPDDSIEEINSILKKYGAVAEPAFPQVELSEDEDLAQYFVVFVDSNMKMHLVLELEADRENVDQVAPNGVVKLVQPQKTKVAPAKPGQFLANDPFIAKQWYASKLNYNAVHKFVAHHKPKKKAKVAIVDTGVDRDHEDLSDNYEDSGTDGDYDLHSHGTHCAGLAGAATNNGKGVGSFNWEGQFITLTGYPALDDQGRGTDLRVARAIIDAADAGADVISMSLGGPAFIPPKAQKDAINYALKKGAIVVVAAGNSNDDARRYSPANIPGVITVAAVDENLRKARFSNVNTKLKMPIAAPGVNILSSVPGGEYMSYNGTSMATPIVAGLLGMMRAYQPEISAKEAYKILNNTGLNSPDERRVGKVINPAAVLEEVVR